MSLNLHGENPDIALRSNWLMVNGHTLRTDVLKDSKSDKLTISGQDLSSILLLGRRTILQSIEELHERQVLQHPESVVTRPSIWIAHVGTAAQTDGRSSQVFTELGYANGGVNTSIDEIKPGFHGHWRAVQDAGFLPEVRRTSGSRDGGSWLLLRKPSLPQVLQHWFGYQEKQIDIAVEIIKDDVQCNIPYYRMFREKEVDQAPDAARSRQQIGLILSMAAIKSAIGDRDGYEQEVDDALIYIDNDPSIDASTVRAIENSTYEIDQ
jgi:hypothetical protein